MHWMTAPCVHKYCMTGKFHRENIFVNFANGLVLAKLSLHKKSLELFAHNRGAKFILSIIQ